MPSLLPSTKHLFPSIVMLLAGCSSRVPLGGGAPPGAGGVEVTVVSGRQPLSKVPVYFHDAKGGLIAAHLTDDAGVVRASTAPAQLTVHVGTDASLRPQLVTYFGVSDGDRLLVDAEEHPESNVAQDLTGGYDWPPPGHEEEFALHDFGHGCREPLAARNQPACGDAVPGVVSLLADYRDWFVAEATSSTPLLETRLRKLPLAALPMVVAHFEGPAPVAYERVEAMRVAIDARRAPDHCAPLTPDERCEQSFASVRALSRGRSFDAAWPNSVNRGNLCSVRGTARWLPPPPFTEGLQVVSGARSGYAGERARVIAEHLPVVQGVVLDEARLPAAIDGARVEREETSRPIVRWQLEGARAPAAGSGVIVRLGLRHNPFGPHWTFVAPPGTTTLEAPVVPESIVMDDRDPERPPWSVDIIVTIDRTDAPDYASFKHRSVLAMRAPVDLDEPMATGESMSLSAIGDADPLRLDAYCPLHFASSLP